MADNSPRPGPWSPWIAVARSILALSMAGSLAVTPSSVLFARLNGIGAVDQCGGTASWSLFCTLPPGESPWASIITVAILVWVASGVLPAVSAVPFAFAAYSVLLPAGFFLHGAILFVMGIASFSIAMFGALLILLIPADSSWSLLANRWYSTAPVRRDWKEEVPSAVS